MNTKKINWFNLMMNFSFIAFNIIMMDVIYINLGIDKEFQENEGYTTALTSIPALLILTIVTFILTAVCGSAYSEGEITKSRFLLGIFTTYAFLTIYIPIMLYFVYIESPEIAIDRADIKMYKLITVMTITTISLIVYPLIMKHWNKIFFTIF